MAKTASDIAAKETETEQKKKTMYNFSISLLNISIGRTYYVGISLVFVLLL